MLNLYIYFLEFKNRIILVLISWICTTVSAYLNKEILLYKFVEPCLNRMDKNSCFYFISTDLMEIFSIYIKISFFVSLHFTVIFSIFHIIAFFFPGMRFKERYRVIIIYTLFVFFWLVSAFLFSTFVLPNVWAFFTEFNINKNNYSVKVFYEAKILNYIDLFINLYNIFNIAVQFFVVLFFLFDYFYNKKNIKKSRKFFYVFFVILATCLTPPDFSSQIIIFLSFLIMFEFIVVFVILINKIN